jgi:hypothetical protein
MQAGLSPRRYQHGLEPADLALKQAGHLQVGGLMPVRHRRRHRTRRVSCRAWMTWTCPLHSAANVLRADRRLSVLTTSVPAASLNACTAYTGRTIIHDLEARERAVMPPTARLSGTEVIVLGGPARPTAGSPGRVFQPRWLSPHPAVPVPGPGHRPGRLVQPARAVPRRRRG